MLRGPWAICIFRGPPVIFYERGLGGHAKICLKMSDGDLQT